MAGIFSALAEYWGTLVRIAKNIAFKDILDIIIVTFVIYSVIKLLRETRAGQLVKGLVLFVAIYLVATYFELVMLGTLLKYFFQSAFIVMIILFQPEIRKALEQVGRNRVGQSIARIVRGDDKLGEHVELAKSIDGVVGAVGMLQQMRMGALIVFERRTKLNEIVASGTVVDADPSAELIGNIFFNKAPLHDGALVIRNGRVYAAGCILPLTGNINVSAMLGTRHRAALGMSEDSDAVIVIVSEETGQISIAENGTLTRDYDRISLKEKLIEILLESESDGKKGKIFSVKKGFSRKKRGAKPDEE